MTAPLGASSPASPVRMLGSRGRSRPAPAHAERPAGRNGGRGGADSERKGVSETTRTPCVDRRGGGGRAGPEKARGNAGLYQFSGRWDRTQTTPIDARITVVIVHQNVEFAVSVADRAVDPSCAPTIPCTATTRFNSLLPRWFPLSRRARSAPQAPSTSGRHPPAFGAIDAR